MNHKFVEKLKIFNAFLNGHPQRPRVKHFFVMEKKERVTRCSVDGCDGKGSIKKNGTEVFSKGYCNAHYLKLLKYGNENIGVTRDGRGKHELYYTYHLILSRCYNIKRKDYKYYGLRGIVVCERWKGNNGFWNFVNDMGKRPFGYSLDRIDVNGNYEPTNCRWASNHEQMANRRNNHINVGVRYNKDKKLWRSELQVNGLSRLKYFKSEQEAIDYRKYLEKTYITKNA